MAKLTKAARRRAALKGIRRKNAAKKRKPSARKRITAALKKYMRNPAKVKGRKVKGGKAVSLKNFTGTVIRKTNGQVVISGRGKKK